MSSRYQIGTRAVLVEVHLTTGARLAGYMFLRPAEPHGGSETVADRLNDGCPFFPLRVEDPEPGVFLVGKHHVRYVVAPSMDEDERVADARGAASQLLVSAAMSDGASFTGLFFVDLPPEKIRALDYVNEPSLAFIPLSHLDKEYLLNRAHILYLKDMTA